MNVRPIPYATEARSGLDHETGDTMLVLTGDGQEVLAAALSEARAEGAREERERIFSEIERLSSIKGLSGVPAGLIQHLRAQSNTEG